MSNARVDAIFTDVVEALRDVVRRHQVTGDEFRAATDWLTEAGSQGYEIPLLLDVFLACTVDDVNSPADGGTESNIEGPFYLPGAPLLSPPYVLPMRADEPGEALTFSGSVRSREGRPVAGAILDVWQANGAGQYSHFSGDVPDGNLRGRLASGEDGRFEFGTVLPSPYEIPKQGATGKLLAALGREAFRPAHVHFKLSADGFRPLTTQIYFEGDPLLDSDVVGAVKASLVTKVERVDGDGLACSYDFVLQAQGSGHERP